MNIQIPHKFLCRPYQVDTWEALKSGKKKVVLCWHRGAGKDLFALNYFVWHMIKNWDRPAIYLHCFPNYSQGKKAIWNSTHNTDDGESMPYLAHFPEDLIQSRNSQEMRIQLKNGTIYQVMGIDGKNAQLARGMNPSHVIISEYAYMNEESWNVIEPRVSQNKGTVIFASTPNGKNHFYHQFNYATSGHNQNYFASMVTNDDTKIHPKEHIDELREQGKPEDFILQEYFCDFTRGAAGSYYGNLIQKARIDNRISNLRISPDLPVNSAWDIGVGDSTSIWCFQCLNNGDINFINYYENHNEGLPHYIHYLENWKEKNKIIWGRHFVPHDMKNKEFGTGDERYLTAERLGYKMTVLPLTKFEEGIDLCRSTFPRCCFDEKSCKFGIECLDMYRKKWNDSLKVYYDQPLHDKYSHGSDAFRYAMWGVKLHGSNSSNRLDADKIKEMRMRNYGY